MSAARLLAILGATAMAVARLLSAGENRDRQVLHAYRLGAHFTPWRVVVNNQCAQVCMLNQWFAPV
jgi:hypothetical protein